MSKDYRKPFLDKISSGPHFGSQAPIGIREDQFVLIPNLQHTGIKTELHAPEIPITNPEGRITPFYKDFSQKKLQPIYRDKKQFDSREVVFKKGHKQFIDKVLVDMEDKKQKQVHRQLKHFSSKKSELGFDQSFNSTIPKGILKSTNSEFERSYSKDLEFEEDTPDGLQVDAPQLAVAPLPPISPPTQKSATRISRADSMMAASVASSSSNSQGHPTRQNSKAYSRMSLFTELLQDTEPPKSPSKRYGSIGNFSAFVLPAATSA